jgi:hypothetical protein
MGYGGTILIPRSPHGETSQVHLLVISEEYFEDRGKIKNGKQKSPKDWTREKTR